MLDARKSAILTKVVTEHIATAQPVGSAHVVRDALIDVSPATVRSDMAALERDGYLTHPHTSAGRVPTDKGYRFFVDQLGEPALDPSRVEQVQDFFARAHGELERLLRDTSRLLSQLTDYAAVVVPPAHDGLSVRSSLLCRIGPHAGVVVLVLSNGAVDKHTVELDEVLGEAELDQAGARLAERLAGIPLSSLPALAAGEESLAGAAPDPVEAVVRSCLEVLASAQRPAEQPGEVFVGGAAHMAEQFPALSTVREVLAILEESFVVTSLLRDVLAHGQQVSIGTEHGLAPLAECSLVVAPYEVGDELVGTIGVLGPTRMNYPQALATVAVVSQHLGRQLTRGA